MKKQVTKTAKTTTRTVAAPVKAKKAASLALPAPVAALAPVAAIEPLSKRVTPDATIQEWRVVVSQRRGKPGWFLQGGNYEMRVNGRNSFNCAAELYFEDCKDAQAALKAKQQAAA